MALCVVSTLVVQYTLDFALKEHVSINIIIVYLKKHEQNVQINQIIGVISESMT